MGLAKPASHGRTGPSPPSQVHGRFQSRHSPSLRGFHGAVGPSVRLAGEAASLAQRRVLQHADAPLQRAPAAPMIPRDSSFVQRHMTEPTDANWSGYSVSRLVPSVLLVNVLLAFAFTVAQYWMTKATGAVTSQVVGTAKNAILSVLSFVIFGDAVTLLAFMGYVVVFCGAGLYTYLRIHGRRAVPAGSAKQ